MNLTEDVKRILITADTFSLKGGHKQLTPSVVLTFILEEYSERYKNTINNFFKIKHKALIDALKQRDCDNSGERYADDLVMCLYKCHKKGIVDIDSLTKELLNCYIITLKNINTTSNEGERTKRRYM